MEMYELARRCRLDAGNLQPADRAAGLYPLRQRLGPLSAGFVPAMLRLGPDFAFQKGAEFTGMF